jgi:hypothetical protein
VVPIQVLYLYKGTCLTLVVPIEKYVFKPTFWLEKLMKLICNKLRNEDQHMF